MARRTRAYTRDSRGRFASSPGGGPKVKPKPRTSFRQRQAVSLARSRGQTGRLGSATKAAKARLKATKTRTGAGASPQQKAALTRAKRMASALAGERRVKVAAKAGVMKGRVRTRKAMPREMSLEQFAYQTNGKTRSDTMSFAIEASVRPHGKTKASDRRFLARYQELDAQVKATEAAYQKAIASGRIKPPSDSLERKAQGHPDNPAVQAAKRLLEKSKKLRAERELARSQQEAASKKQSLTMEQRKRALLRVHGAAMEKDLSARKGISRIQVRDILDNGSPEVVVRNVKKWGARNRKSMSKPQAAPKATRKPRAVKPPLRPEYVEIVAENKRKLQSLNRRIRQNPPGVAELKWERKAVRFRILTLESEGRAKEAPVKGAKPSRAWFEV